MKFFTNYMLDCYAKDIEKYPLLTSDREKELSRIIQHSQDRDEVIKARNEMVECNLRLVVKLAIDFYSKVCGMDESNVTVMDLIQAGNIGLMRAADLFSYKKNFKFCTYAYPSIIRKMKRALMQSHFIRIPDNHFKHISQLKDLEARTKGQKLTDDQIKIELNISDDMLEMIRTEKRSKVNIDETEYMSDSIVDENEVPLEKQLSRTDLKNYLYEKMKQLKPFDRDVLFYKFFGDETYTLNKIGDKYGVSRERVRIAIIDALHRLRKLIDQDNEEVSKHGKKV